MDVYEPSGIAPKSAGRGWHGVVVVALALFLYVPYMGSYGLWDPWEGHYAEVARQMLERNDPIELRWHNGRGPDGRKENVFWSKPVLTFWLMAAGLGVGGFNDAADPGEMARSLWTEWALRWPFVALAVFCVWTVWFAVSQLVSARAGWLAAIILATCPQFFFIARQAMTDMPFVAPMTSGLCLFLLAMFGPDSERETKSARRVFWAVLFLCVVPQVLMLAGGIRRTVAVAQWRLQVNGWLDAMPYVLGLALLFWVARRCRSARQMYLFLFYVLCGVAMLAKGLPGPALPGLVIFSYLVFTGEWAILARAELLRGMLVFMLVSFPWYHGMLVRAGRGFWNEFFGHHHLKRLTAGVHGDKGTFEYFVHQLGFALFPWSGLVPAALTGFLGLRRAESNADRVRLFVLLWCVVTFTLFSLSVTKFHHYIFPVVPPMAILLAIWLDDLLDGRVRAARAMILVSLGVFVFVARDLVLNPQRLIWLFVYNYGRAWPSGYDYGGWLLALSVAMGAMLAALWVARWRRFAMIGALGVAISFAWFSLNKYMIEISPHWSQKAVLATYYRLRQSAEEELIAWQMNWRSETFYTKAEVVVALNSDNAKFTEYVRSKEGKRVFFLCERSRYTGLARWLPTDRAKESLRIVDGRSNKFYLVVSDI